MGIAIKTPNSWAENLDGHIILRFLQNAAKEANVPFYEGPPKHTGWWSLHIGIMIAAAKLKTQSNAIGYTQFSRSLFAFFFYNDNHNLIIICECIKGNPIEIRKMLKQDISWASISRNHSTTYRIHNVDIRDPDSFSELVNKISGIDTQFLAMQLNNSGQLTTKVR